MNTDEPHKESAQGDHVWPPILEALKWQPYIPEAGSLFLDREFMARHEPIHIPPFTSPPENP